MTNNHQHTNDSLKPQYKVTGYWIDFQSTGNFRGWLSNSGGV